MELIRNIDRSPTKQRLVGAMVTLCRQLEVQSVAEGVETVQERDMVAEAGAGLLQGFLYGRPERDFVGEGKLRFSSPSADVVGSVCQPTPFPNN